MARDAFEAGPDGTFPNFPRKPDGSPDYERAGIPTGPDGKPARTVRHRAPDGTVRIINYEPTAGTTPVVPPTIPGG